MAEKLIFGPRKFARENYTCTKCGNTYEDFAGTIGTYICKQCKLIKHDNKEQYSHP